MKETVITHRQAARRMPWLMKQMTESDCVTITRNGQPIVRVVPIDKKGCTGKSLLEAIKKSRLTDKEATLWRSEIEEGRKELLPPGNPWG